VIGCANQESTDWLKSFSGVIRVKDVPLRVLPADELPNRYRVVVHVEEADLTAAVKLLDRQNTGLAAREWIVMRGSESRDAKCATLPLSAMQVNLKVNLNHLDAEALKNCGFKPCCGLGRAAVKLLDKKSSEDAVGPTQGKTEINGGPRHPCGSN